MLAPVVSSRAVDLPAAVGFTVQNTEPLVGYQGQPVERAASTVEYTKALVRPSSHWHLPSLIESDSSFPKDILISCEDGVRQSRCSTITKMDLNRVTLDIRTSPRGLIIR